MVLEADLCHRVLGFDHVALLICTLPFASAAGSQEGTMGPVTLSFPCSLPWSIYHVRQQGLGSTRALQVTPSCYIRRGII